MPLRLPKSRTARALLLLGLTAAFALVMTGAIALRRRISHLPCQPGK